jgi:hypothetical protein
MKVPSFLGGQIKCIVKQPSVNTTYILPRDHFTFIPLVPGESYHIEIGVPQWPIPVMLPDDTVEISGTLNAGETRKYIFTPPFIGGGQATIKLLSE